jgi:predicted ArsR family transcriptional regulator
VGRPKTRPAVLTETDFRRLIQRTLRKHPDVTVSMLAAHIRPYGKEWRRVLEQMITESLVVRKVEFEEGCARAKQFYALTELGLAADYPLPKEPTKELAASTT